MIDHLSYSSVTAYLDCPENWRRKYILKEPTTAGPALTFGTAVHGAIEAQLAGRGKALDNWREAWQKAIEKQETAWGADTPEQHFNEGVRLLGDTSIAGGLDGLRARTDQEGAMIERKVVVNVPGVDVPVIGYIDVILSDGTPADFKTSSRSWTDGQAQDSLQSLFYLAGLSQAGKLHPSREWRFKHIVLVKTKKPQIQMLEHVHRPGEVLFLFEVIRRVWRAIQFESFPINPTGWKCNPAYCDFYANCRGKF